MAEGIANSLYGAVHQPAPASPAGGETAPGVGSGAPISDADGGGFRLSPNGDLKRRLPRLQFSSAGLETTAVDPKTVEFLAGKGINISGQTSKSLAQVPELDAQQIVVLFGQEARKAFKPAKAKTIVLDWPTADPSAVKGLPEQILAAYEQTYQQLNSQIRDLTEAIVGDRELPQPSPSKA
jgi:protein-tyrosine-phosphatase